MADRSPISTVLRWTFAPLLLVAASYAVDWVLRAENVPVRNVRFEGPFKRVTQAELEGAVLDLLRGNFFLVDLDAVQRRVEDLPWVRRAAVHRRFPQDIAVHFTEQRLAARWGEDAWVNTNGEVVQVSGDDLPGALPRLDGPQGTAAEVLAAYAQFRERLAALELELVGLALSARRHWELEVKTAAGGRRFTLVADHERPLPRLERFAQVYTATLARRSAGIERVDLRYTNGFAVQWGRGTNRAQAAGALGGRNEG